MIRPSFIRRIYPFIREHQAMEAAAVETMRSLLSPTYCGPFRRQGSLLTYAQRNAFSIMFMALYGSLGMDREKRRFYGTITHAIRGMVTGTDNLLDDEYKEMIPLRFPAGARRFRSVMHVMLFDRLLSATLEDAAQRGAIPWEAVPRVEGAILRHLAPIGAQEAEEEEGVEEILPPEEVLRRVVAQRGGNLLRLAFVAPRLLEPDHGPMELADRGVFHIGMALQVVDDLTDLQEDLAGRRHNLAVSWIHHRGAKDERDGLAKLRAGLPPSRPLHRLVAPSFGELISLAVAQGLHGFGLLEEAGFWLDQAGALSLIRTLFRLRGVGHLLEFVPRRIPAGLEAAPDLPWSDPLLDGWCPAP